MKYIPLTNSELYAIVDDDAYEMVKQYSWQLLIKHGKPIAVTTCLYTGNYSSKTIYMHRLVTGATDDQMIDHKNCIVIDNRFENLRVCTQSQNNQNSRKRKNTSSKYKGPYWAADRGCWRSQIKVNDKCIKLGNFPTEIAAARAYNRAAIKYFGEFAKLNEFGDPLVGSEKEKEDGK